MNNPKRFKRNTVLATLGLAAALTFCGSSHAQTLGDIVGYAKTISTGIGGFIGSTTVTPAYALKTWREDSYGYYSNIYLDSRWRVNRSMVTGAYLYEYRRLRFDGTWAVETDPFNVSVVQRLNYYCDLSSYNEDGTVNLFIFNTIRNFDIAVWADQVVKTGYFPPAQPYPAQLKSVATKLQTSCNPPTPYSQETRREVQINDTGYVTTQMALVSYDYTWPMLCWVGGAYDY